LGTFNTLLFNSLSNPTHSIGKIKRWHSIDNPTVTYFLCKLAESLVWLLVNVIIFSNILVDIYHDKEHRMSAVRRSGIHDRPCSFASNRSNVFENFFDQTFEKNLWTNQESAINLPYNVFCFGAKITYQIIDNVSRNVFHQFICLIKCDTFENNSSKDRNPLMIYYQIDRSRKQSTMITTNNVT